MAYTFAAIFENMTPIDNGHINGTCNTIGNLMVGNSDNNVLAGSLDQSNTRGKIIPLTGLGSGALANDTDYFQKRFWSIPGSSICVSMNGSPRGTCVKDFR